MAVVHIIDTLADWARVNICREIMLKVPPENEDAMDSGYRYKTANPAVFPLYVPSGDKLPANIDSPIPCLRVRFLSVQDDLAAKTGGMDVQFGFCVWDPGKHSEDTFIPNGDGTFRRQDAAGAEFERNAEGWRDLWNFVDLAARKLQAVDSIGLCTIDKSTPFEYGPLKVDGEIADSYPFWEAEMSFRVTYPLMRNNEDLEQYL